MLEWYDGTLFMMCFDNASETVLHDHWCPPHHKQCTIIDDRCHLRWYIHVHVHVHVHVHAHAHVHVHVHLILSKPSQP
jgi:hypothetical protein